MAGQLHCHLSAFSLPGMDGTRRDGATASMVQRSGIRKLLTFPFFLWESLERTGRWKKLLYGLWEERAKEKEGRGNSSQDQFLADMDNLWHSSTDVPDQEPNMIGTFRRADFRDRSL